MHGSATGAEAAIAPTAGRPTAGVAYLAVLGLMAQLNCVTLILAFLLRKTSSNQVQMQAPEEWRQLLEKLLCHCKRHPCRHLGRTVVYPPDPR